MSRCHPFGWSLPPGCTDADIEDAWGGEDEDVEEEAEDKRGPVIHPTVLAMLRRREREAMGMTTITDVRVRCHTGPLKVWCNPLGTFDLIIGDRVGGQVRVEDMPAGLVRRLVKDLRRALVGAVDLDATDPDFGVPGFDEAEAEVAEEVRS